MQLPKLLFIIALIAIALTFIIGKMLNKKKSWIMTYLQNFVGVFFIISGFVKAIDPLGTAYKTGDYMNEFFIAFDGSFLKPIAGVFTFMNEHTVFLATAMIVFEIVLGIMLILGHRPKLTASLFLILMGAFTLMTGFTYLTGYVSPDINFFEFSKWGEYLDSNRKVTDCGCFGDFMKLKPIVTFTKDVILLIPGLYFLLRSKDQHQLFTKKTRDIIALGSIVAFTVYSMSNFAWDIPKIDFRPFKRNVDIVAQKELEENAMANVSILSWTLENINTKEVKTIGYDEYMKNYKSYPKTEWKIIDQEKTEPAIKSTKISEFELVDPEYGDDVYGDVMSLPDNKLMIVCYDLHTESTGNNTYKWDDHYMEIFNTEIKPVVEAAQKDGTLIYMPVGGADFEMIKAFLDKIGLKNIKYFTTDYIVLKTIVRSNPGIVLFKGSTIIDKWHHSKVPNYSSMKKQYSL